MTTAVEEISHEKLWAKIRNGADFVLVDAHLPISYAGAHLPGAISIPPEPVDELASSRTPSPDTEIVVYCANPRCETQSR